MDRHVEREPETLHLDQNRRRYPQRARKISGAHFRRDTLAARDARASRKVKITDALLREVASVYRANVNDRPTEAVAEHFGRQHRTATQYIKRARERGFLGPAIKGKAGEQ